jgi:hypothetical protein
MENNLIQPPNPSNPKQDLFKFVNVIDDRVGNSGEKRLYPIYRSNQSVTPVQLEAITSTSASTKFATQDLTPNYRIDPKVTMSGYLYFYLAVSVTVAIPNGDRVAIPNLSNGVTIGVDYLPLWSCINNGDVLINDTQIENKEVSTMKSLMARLASTKTNNIYSNDPSALEYACKYSDVIFTGYNNLANLFSATDTYIPNGSYPLYFVDDAGDLQLTPVSFNSAVYGAVGANVAVGVYQVPVAIKFNSVLPFAPFVYNNDKNIEFNSQGLEYIKNIKVNLTLNDGSSVFKILNSSTLEVPDGGGGGAGRYILGVGVANSQTSFGTLQNAPFGSNKPTLNYIVLESPESAVIERPLKSVTPIVSYEQYLKQISSTTFASGQTVSVKSNLIPVSRVPSLVLFGLMPNTPIKSPLYSNFLFSLTDVVGAVNVQWNNQTGRCATFSKRDLYNSSLNNGIDQDWLSWSGASVAVSNALSTTGQAAIIPLCGGWCALKPSIEIVTSITESPNVETNINFYVTANFTNQTAENYSGQLLNFYVYCLYNDAMVINASNSICEKVTGIISPQDLLDTDAKAPAVSQNQLVDKYVGGSVLGKLHHSHRKLHHHKSSQVSQVGGVMSAGSVMNASRRSK